MKITANGISINYQIDGRESAPWLIFSNSLLTDLTMWDDQVAALKDSFRILRYDQRGHGGTQVTDGKYTFDLLAADVIGLMDALGIKRAHFVGISMGGMTALSWRRNTATALTASSPATAARLRRRGRAAMAGAHRARQRQGHGGAGRCHHAALVPARLRRDQVAGARQGARHDRGDAAPGLCRLRGGAVELRPAAGLAGIANPTLLIVGTKDATRRRIKAINQAVPGSSVVELEGAGHLSNLEQPQNSPQSIRGFIKAA